MSELSSMEIEKSLVTGFPRSNWDGSRVRYRAVHGSASRWLITAAIAFGAIVILVSYLVWQLHHMALATLTMGIILAFLVDALRVTFTLSLSWAVILARKPEFLPIRAADTSRVILLVTFVPSSEDPDMLEGLLRAAKAIRYRAGDFSIAVLDEGDGTVVTPIVDRVNADAQGHPVYRISRNGIAKYNQPSGKFEAKTKHGNINAGLEVIHGAPDRYGEFDIVMGLDPDHIPMTQFAERMLGYFSDPDVAYIAGPQSYANSRSSLVAKLAESQQFVFHTVSQTGANAANAAMLVGTSYAIRTSVLKQVGGIQPSITEDMATALAVLSRRNPATGKLWKSVYTPDLLAHGEGPSTWGDFFKQQDRWSRGAIEYIVTGKLAAGMLRMWRNPLGVIHYGLLMTFYLIMGTVWLVAAGNMIITTFLGPTAIEVEPSHWAVFYAWVAAFQITLYTMMRRHNTSPYEENFSWGIYGMFMSVISAPVYASALIKTILRRPAGFSVTPKGAKSKGDSWYTFRLNIGWTVFYLGLTAIAFLLGNMPAASMFWPVLAATLSIAPVLLWRFERRNNKVNQDPAEVPEPEDNSTAVAEETRNIVPVRNRNVVPTGARDGIKLHADAGIGD